MTNKQLQQLKKWNKLIKDIKEDVAKSYINSAMRQAYYQKVDFKEEVIIS